jgi:hypothetical protein
MFKLNYEFINRRLRNTTVDRVLNNTQEARVCFAPFSSCSIYERGQLGFIA